MALWRDQRFTFACLELCICNTVMEVDPKWMRCEDRNCTIGLGMTFIEKWDSASIVNSSNIPSFFYRIRCITYFSTEDSTTTLADVVAAFVNSHCEKKTSAKKHLDDYAGAVSDSWMITRHKKKIFKSTITAQYY